MSEAEKLLGRVVIGQIAMPAPDLIVDCAQGLVHGWTATALADVLKLMDDATARIDTVAAEKRERWMKAATAALEILDDMPAWSNAGHACQLLREAMA